MPLVLDGTNGVSGVDGTASNPAIEGTDSNTGIFYPAADTVAIGTGGTEALRVNSSQNVGIGTSTPGAPLDVAGNIRSRDGGFVLSTGTTQRGGVYMYNRLTGSGVDYSTSIFSETGQPIYFCPNGSVTRAMTLDASGNLGVGATSVNTKLELRTDTTTAGSEPNILLNNKGASNTTPYAVGGIFGAAWRDVRDPAYIAGINFYRNSNSGGLNSSGEIRFYTAGDGGTLAELKNNEKARITSSGFFKAQGNSTYDGATGLYHEFIGATNNASVMVIKSNSANGTQYGPAIVTANDQNDATRYFLSCAGGATERATIRSNGGIANYTANNSPLSDRRLKTDIKPADSYLEKICAIPVVTYLYKDQTDELLNLGVIAQDVQTAAPELCNEEGWGTKAEDGTNYLGIWETDLHYAVMKAVQELKAIVDTQAIRIEALEAEVQALKGNA
jgi:hypothetical protein